MMHHKVLILLAVVFGIYQLFKIKDAFARLIIAMQVVGICTTFVPIASGVTIGFSIFILSAILGCAYPFIKKDIVTSKKALILAVTLPVTVANIFAIARLPLTGILGFVMILPLAALVYIIIKNLSSYKNEIGFLVIFAIDALIKLLMSVEWISFK